MAEVTDSAILWRPPNRRVAGSRLAGFLQESGHSDFARLYQWSVERPDEFWRSIAEFVDILWDTPPSEIVRHLDRMPGAQWFPQAELNFARNLLEHGERESPALICRNEHGRETVLSFAELKALSMRFAQALHDAGVGPGDRVAGLLPNIAESVIAMLGATTIGAVWSSCSPDFGYDSVLDRFGQISPKVLVAVDGYVYAGKRFNLSVTTENLASALESVERVVVIAYLDKSEPVGGSKKIVAWEHFLAEDATCGYRPLPFAHPLYILYSSGTTGKPKCITHSAGGTLIQHLKELILHTDLKPGDRILYFTTTGWMMWNWLLSSLAVGATVVLFDGSPFYPAGSQLWDIAEQERLDVLGVSAKYLAECARTNLEPMASHDLSALRTILSTGSPLGPEGFDYVYTKVKKDIHLASISGGTDLISCFALGNPLGPVRRGEIQTRGLGMKVEVFDEEGRSLPPGEKGELVCTAPFPSMPIGFWGDRDGTRYRAAYFETFPGVWRHGDWCELTPSGGLVIWGRSDTVLNPGGVRIGTAEIYRAIDTLPEVVEACAVGQEWEGDVRVILFVRLSDGVILDDALRQEIRREIRRRASPRHVPARIVAIADLPRTRNGKLAESAVRDMIHGRSPNNRHALANPETLELFRDVEDLRT